MKNTLTVILGVIIVFSLSACINITEADEMGLALESKGLSLISEVDSLAECEELITLYSNSNKINEIVREIGEGDYTQPKAVFIIENLDELMFKYMLPHTTLPSEIKEMLKVKFAPVLPSQINAMNGVDVLAATSILTHGDSFIYEGLQNTVTYFYIFDNSYSFVVTFIPNDENIVNASVSVIMSEDLTKWSTTDEALEYFRNALYFEDVSISMIKKQK